MIDAVMVDVFWSPPVFDPTCTKRRIFRYDPHGSSSPDHVGRACKETRLMADLCSFSFVLDEERDDNSACNDARCLNYF